ncbi:hypothetical protein MHBO_004958 [Bonamia ostreae]|uniref:DNL-type domain-containing protein n=1 Tax=Bonamia ostreae TaxID=126728 RepID=A0ABV2AVH5_9EUKA
MRPLSVLRKCGKTFINRRTFENLHRPRFIRHYTENRTSETSKLVAAIKDPKKSLISQSKHNPSKYQIMFSCGECRRHMTKSFSKQAYENGYVMIKCDGCDGMHLIADNLKWFSERTWRIDQVIKKEREDLEKTFRVIDERDLK